MKVVLCFLMVMCVSAYVENENVKNTNEGAVTPNFTETSTVSESDRNDHQSTSIDPDDLSNVNQSQGKQSSAENGKNRSITSSTTSLSDESEQNSSSIGNTSSKEKSLLPTTSSSTSFSSSLTQSSEPYQPTNRSPSIDTEDSTITSLANFSGSTEQTSYVSSTIPANSTYQSTETKIERQTTADGTNSKSVTSSSSASKSEIEENSSSTASAEMQTTTETDQKTDSSTTMSISSTTSTTEPTCSDDLETLNLTITPYNFNVTLQWNVPENPCHAIWYLVYLDNELKENTTEAAVTIPDLSACTYYEVSVAVSNGTAWGPQVNDSFKTTTPDPFEYGVQNLKLQRSDYDLNVNWEPPPKSVSQCIISYEYVVMLDENHNDTNTADGTNITLPLIGCINYTITVWPIVSESILGINETGNFSDTLPINITNLSVTTKEKTSIKVLLTTVSQEINNCSPVEIVVKCDALESENSNYSWIKTPKQAQLNTFETKPNYTLTIEDLSPFTNYTCRGCVKNEGDESDCTEIKVTTEKDVPTAPTSVTITEPSSHSFEVKWAPPDKIPAILNFYYLWITNKGPKFNLPKDCVNPNNITDYFFNITDLQKTEFNFTQALPYHDYSISILGATDAGMGNNATSDITTKSFMPDRVEDLSVTNNYSINDTYFGTATVEFHPSCNINGRFTSYKITSVGIRNDFPEHIKVIETDKPEIELELKPERDYNVTVTVITENFTSPESSLSFSSKPGVPSLGTKMLPPSSNDTTKAYFTLSKSAFNETNGNILFYALILSPKIDTIDQNYGFWTNSVWPELPKTNGNSFQLTPPFWEPFKDGQDEVAFIIGKDNNCSDKYCNTPLEEDTEYSLVVRALTSATYRDSAPMYFKTEALQDLSVALGSTFGVLAALILIVLGIYLWRRKHKTLANQEEKRDSASSPAPIPCKKFADYYRNIKENANILKSQYAMLATQSKEVATSTCYAQLPENRRKNRYTNILPYDVTRVKLKIDEDDEIGSDYINASYVKGYTGQIEYIATQGPLESTSKDFWKMILQEHVSIIVMVSQFVEQNKEKCFQYFPNNHESINFGESLEVKCSTELHFGTYCIRTLQVRKDTLQRNVIHMQFLEWPDFGVPQNTDNMMQFCHQMRERVNGEGGLIVIHCSAGVGRTGTLIALDILLQTIDHHRDIDIYKTVLDLRKQRTNMVQTEKQYLFIHTCIQEYLEAPTIQSKEQKQDHLYENMNVLKSSLKKTLIEAEVESAL